MMAATRRELWSTMTRFFPATAAVPIIISKFGRSIFGPPAVENRVRSLSRCSAVSGTGCELCLIFRALPQRKCLAASSMSAGPSRMIVCFAQCRKQARVLRSLRLGSIVPSHPSKRERRTCPSNSQAPRSAASASASKRLDEVVRAAWFAHILIRR
jgi:hypothetical protein